MDREFVFQTDTVEDFVLPQLAAALKTITERRSRSACPRLWSITDRLNEAQAAAPQTPSKPRILLSVCNFILGLFLMVIGTMGGMLPVLFVGLAAWLWSILRLRRKNPRLLGLLALIGGGILTLMGSLAPDQLGRILVPGLVTMAVGFLAVFSHARKPDTGFDARAAQLLDQRNRLPKAAIRFTDTGMTGRVGESIPYTDWEGCWETSDLLLPVCRDSILILRKGELVGGDFQTFRSFLSQQLAIHTIG